MATFSAALTPIQYPGFNQPAGRAWSTFSHTFTTPGEYPYYCTLHGGPGGAGMAGTVIVRESNNSEEKTIYLPVIRRGNTMAAFGVDRF